MKKVKNKTGRPTVVTQEVIAKLEMAFRDGANVDQAVQVAKISRDTFDRRIADTPTFAEKMTDAQHYPSLISRKLVLDRIKKRDVEQAKWWLERKDKKEFSTRSELTGEDGEKLFSITRGDNL